MWFSHSLHVKYVACKKREQALFSCKLKVRLAVNSCMYVYIINVVNAVRVFLTAVMIVNKKVGLYLVI